MGYDGSYTAFLAALCTVRTTKSPYSLGNSIHRERERERMEGERAIEKGESTVNREGNREREKVDLLQISIEWQSAFN